MARGTQTSQSDVDVLVVGEVDFTEVVMALHPCQDTLARELNPVVYSEAEWRARVDRDDPFVRDILQNPVMLLLGVMDDAR